jgi:cation diffusion facilitator CzcD-associated flavoprotein CzcO
MSRCDVVVIGAGPYGLAVAAHLRGRGLNVRTFGLAMHSWRAHMPDGMFLKSEGFASSISDPAGRLTLRRFCHESGRSYADVAEPVSIDTFVEYGAWFEQQAVLDVEPEYVARVEPADAADGAFAVRIVTGESVEARRVVVATGLTGFAETPSELLALPGHLRSHTYDHDSFEVFHGRSVAVVGAGQSALESAVLLREAGAAPRIVVRAPAVLWNPRPDRHEPGARRVPVTPLGAGWKMWAYWRFRPMYRYLPADRRVHIAKTTLGPAGAWWLRPRLTGDVPLVTDAGIVGAAASNGGVRLRIAGSAGGRELEAEHVIAGTGYRVDVDRLGFLAPELRSRLERVEGAPRLSSSFESSVPGLYFVGLAAANTFGPAMRFVCGTGFAARRVAAHAVR